MQLGAFGWLSSAEVKAKGVVNAGLLDQQFALTWVQKYISLFGGDATKVTISGESSGGGSVMYHALAYGGSQPSQLFINVSLFFLVRLVGVLILTLTSYMSQGIAASPYLWPQYSYNGSVPTARFYDFSKAAGCPASGQVLDCLVTKDSMTLQYASSNISTTQTYGSW
jgi:hypothetical protein